ncbi:nuclease [Flavisolibacter sp. BT320]|nr:nuclease [Flavisolibacter longurius]
MPFTLIKGTFHVKNLSPDGDTIKFAPTNPELIRELPGFKPKALSMQGRCSVRIEAIDTLETHYSVKGSPLLHQPIAFAHKATDTLLNYLGITNVKWNEKHQLILDANDGTPGFILSRNIEKNGRPVAFVYAGEIEKEDGTDFNLDVDDLKKSYNYKALAEGLAYPTYYKGLFPDLRDEFTRAVKNARMQTLGLYGIDKTNTGIDVQNMATITEEFAILPKLFRRLAVYLAGNGSAIGFKEKMAETKEEVVDLSNGHFTHFDTFISQEPASTFLRLTKFPEELVFDEMPLRPTEAIVDLLMY